MLTSGQEPGHDAEALLRLGLGSLAGRRLGVYDVESRIGAGGMGEVYRARDTRLDRAVAIKVLHRTDAALQKRFEREARLIAALSHPNICTLLDVGQDAGVDYLVMELIDGDTLATRLSRGPLPIDQALVIAIGVASALDRAHRSGVTHRDLKPGNVMLPRSGPKLVDFGLALPHAITTGGDSTTERLTEPGSIVGTFQYIAPEQLAGEAGDARSDIWAFGCVVYEMLTGRAPFSGSSAAHLIGAILKDDPAPIALPAAPPILEEVVRTCLKKDPADRFQSAHDLVLQLKWIAQGSGIVASPIATERRHRRGVLRWAVMIGLVLLTAGSTYVAIGGREPAAPPSVRFTIEAPPGTSILRSAISPDGTRVVLETNDSANQKRLWIRALDAVEARPVSGISDEREIEPFWSPDGKSLGFFTANMLQRIDLDRGTITSLAAASRTPAGGTWNAEGVILYSPTRGNAAPSGIWRINANGGTATVVAAPDEARGEINYRWPEFLPDGQHFLFLIVTTGQFAIAMGDLRSGTVTRLIDSDRRAFFAAPGYLLTWRNGGMVAQRFDADRGALSGDVIPVTDHTGLDGTVPDFSVSAAGVVVSGDGPRQPVTQPTWVDRAGKSLGTVGEPGEYYQPELSPDEGRLSFSRTIAGGGTTGIWMLDIARRVPSLLASGSLDTILPLWSPDGERILYSSGAGGRNAIREVPAGGGPSRTIFEPIYRLDDYSRDGRYLAFQHNDANGNVDIWVLPLFGDHKPIPLVASAFRDRLARFAPDTRMVAYTSNESGSDEVYAQPFPGTSGRVQISSSGGRTPMWRGDGTELYYLGADDTIMAVPVTTAPRVGFGAPHPLFKVPFAGDAQIREYIPTRNGQRFLVEVLVGDPTPSKVTVLTNWLAAAKR